MRFDPVITCLSVLPSLAASRVALGLLARRVVSPLQLIVGGVLVGGGIGTMHYSGMAAMQMAPLLRYDPWMFALSILVAVLLAIIALWVRFGLRNSSPRAFFSKALASLVMGAAIIGMHYTGMAAAQFPAESLCGALYTGLNTQWLATVVIIVTLAVFAIAFVLSMLDAHAARLSTSLHQAHDELLKLALHDSLTRLPNRLLFATRLEQRIQECQHSQRSLYF